MTGDGRVRQCLLIGLCCLLLLVACAVVDGDQAAGEAAVSSPEAPTSSPIPAPPTPSPITATAAPTAQLSPTPTLPLPTPTLTSIATPTATATPSLIPTSATVAGWLIYDNDFFGYSFSYPPEARISTQGVTGFPTEELPEDMTADEYRQQLEQIYPHDICVSVRYRSGFVTIKPSEEAGGRYGAPCGITGIGVYDGTAITETIMLDGRPTIITGSQLREVDETAAWAAEYFIIRLDDGTRIDVGSFRGTQEEYLEIKGTLLQIVSSFHSEATSESISLPVTTPSPMPLAEHGADWLVYANDFYDYQFTYPSEATIKAVGIGGSFPTEEKPEDMTPDEFLQYLQETYPGDICVSIRYKTGFVIFEAPWEEGAKYAAPCGITGVGDYDVFEVMETVLIEGRPYTADGTLVRERDEEAGWHNEFYVITLEDETRIHYGSAIGTEEAYLEIKETLLQIVTSYRSDPH